MVCKQRGTKFAMFREWIPRNLETFRNSSHTFNENFIQSFKLTFIFDLIISIYLSEDLGLPHLHITRNFRLCGYGPRPASLFGLLSSPCLCRIFLGYIYATKFSLAIVLDQNGFVWVKLGETCFTEFKIFIILLLFYKTYFEYYYVEMEKY